MRTIRDAHAVCVRNDVQYVNALILVDEPAVRERLLVSSGLQRLQDSTAHVTPTPSCPFPVIQSIVNSKIAGAMCHTPPVPSW